MVGGIVPSNGLFLYYFFISWKLTMDQQPMALGLAALREPTPSSVDRSYKQYIYLNFLFILVLVIHHASSRWRNVFLVDTSGPRPPPLHYEFVFLVLGNWFRSPEVVLLAVHV